MQYGASFCFRPSVPLVDIQSRAGSFLDSRKSKNDQAHKALLRNQPAAVIIMEDQLDFNPFMEQRASNTAKCQQPSKSCSTDLGISIMMPMDLAPASVPMDLAPASVPIMDLAPASVPIMDLAPASVPIMDLAPASVPMDLAPASVPIMDLAPASVPMDLAPASVPMDLAPASLQKDVHSHNTAYQSCMLPALNATVKGIKRSLQDDLTLSLLELLCCTMHQLYIRVSLRS
ncbi:hypothetical protein CEUSTIGMA_g11153.t1 [Chlamydomonas eustigma]|uniref:Uncharacterized protein n=1 Tax=Chlamydomonas eustigma TaxID=1157962 RepID=A0A250XKX5_9CHLO|nr:hypothetical protein CEUSTIGMA_g11153.t1 [Chlamydomonas eustigma]|eukprot:GAX83728.1 hypothetical protein CEUSTIGMA_g11153.t1 [Chlamydomonas eustigma]